MTNTIINITTSEIMENGVTIKDLKTELNNYIKNDYEEINNTSFDESQVYNVFDDIYAMLGYTHNLYNDLENANIQCTSDLIDYVLVESVEV